MTSRLFEATYNPDVLSCLANLSSDEVFTPPELANRMLDLLPLEIWSNPNITFLDPASKSGVFLREIAKRLIDGLEEVYPNLEERLNHIYREQLFGIALTELTSLLSRRSIYCSKYPNSKYAIVEFEDAEGNLRFKNIQHSWCDKKCVYCGAPKKVHERDTEFEQYAYEFIHLDDASEVLPVKFDVIIGNPPYQLNDGGQNASAIPIYHLFIEQAKKLNPRYMSFIIPARWFDSGRNLGSFRRDMLTDKRVRRLVDFPNSADCFPGVDIAGGVCYFLWQRDYEGDCEVTTSIGGKDETSIRRLDEYPTFVRSSKALSIIKKVESRAEPRLEAIVSSQSPYGLRTYARPEKTGELLLRWNGGLGPISRDAVTKGLEWIDKWKVFTSYRTSDHAGKPDAEGKRRIISVLEVAGPKKVCTETYLSIGSFFTEAEATNLASYIRTKFVRFLILQAASAQQLSKSSFFFVPMQDFTHPWNDEQLSKKYGLTDEEIALIDSMIKPMPEYDQTDA